MFTKKLVTIMILCGVLSLILIVLLLQSGPRVRDVVYNKNELTKSTGQTIVLKLNQPVHSVDKSQVQIQPATDFTVTNAGESLVLRLKQRLDYQTKYTVTISDLTSNRGTKTNYATTITTNPADYLYLKRNFAFSYSEKVPDQIKDGSTGNIVYSAPKIYDFTYINNKLVVQTGDEKDHELVIYDLKNNSEQSVRLPERGTIEHLHASNNNTLFGFAFYSSKVTDGKPKYENTLFLYDFKANIIGPVNGIDKQPLSVVNWEFSPDGTSILAQTYTSGILIVDSTGKNSPLPIGTLESIGNFSGDGSVFSGYDAQFGHSIVNIQSKERTRATVTPVPGKESYINVLYPLYNSSRIIRSIDTVSIEGDDSSQAIEIGSNNSYKQIFITNTSSASFENIYASRNDQYIAVEMGSSNGNQKFDQYDYNSRPRNVTTKLINSTDGSIAKEVDGFAIVWKN